MLTFRLMPIAGLPCHVRPLVCDYLGGERLLDEMNSTVVVYRDCAGRDAVTPGPLVCME